MSVSAAQLVRIGAVAVFAGIALILLRGAVSEANWWSVAVWLALGSGFAVWLSHRVNHRYLASSFALFVAAWSIKIRFPDLDLVGMALLGLLAGNLWAARHDRASWWGIISCFIASALVLFSGTAGGADPMREWLLGLGVGVNDVEQVVILIRKSIHVLFYGSLAATFSMAIAKSINLGWIRLALAWCAIHACFDEFRQTLAANRTGQWIDVVLDLAGALLGIVVVAWYLRKKQKSGLLDIPSPS